MLLHHLVRQLDVVPGSGVPNVEITGVCEDSRHVAPGSLFVARAGTKADGKQYLADAKARGAVAAIVQSQVGGAGLPQIVVKDPGIAASYLANAFYDHPGRLVRTLAVTGTNGKTTTTYIVRHLLAKLGLRCGLIGTVEIDDGRTRREASMTTPAACDIAQLLGAMRDKGCRAAVMEASSHALDQGRVAGVPFVGAAFTNLTGDHLDYHKTMEGYAAAKARLFTNLDPTAVAIINQDDEYSPLMIENCAARIIRFGLRKGADYRASDVHVSPQGSSFTMHTPEGRQAVQMQLVGKHNIENVLAAAALVGEVFGASLQQLANGLRDAQGAPGRLQAVRCGQPFAVLVDYAHTDDALENVLSALRPLTRGNLRVLFGCGGDRDATKRPRMARIAEKFADRVYVTSDNPRTEDPRSILEQIIGGFSMTGRAKASIEIDRRAAIEHILADAGPDDIVLLAGKGHENYQIIGTEKRHFDDVEEATRCLRGRQIAA
ncbi:MAG TPA: UDP-N-acetylmuramoyl-L-alanyl-D-glutamate--2,6-diaminopimelate ligase [Humisphaera sp.]|jgi:UDP-N-acetylmuramoyl-L-alanyl-D-glutamate--2,6-diaminopimelate ligase|nr:UDP-N-acetylmuramoyl-L-alanyl-D-glutamate--2,6-diaminopimelate ligase [Humisphaera sp.]